MEIAFVVFSVLFIVVSLVMAFTSLIFGTSKLAQRSSFLFWVTNAIIRYNSLAHLDVIQVRWDNLIGIIAQALFAAALSFAMTKAVRAGDQPQPVEYVQDKQVRDAIARMEETLAILDEDRRNRAALQEAIDQKE